MKSRWLAKGALFVVLSGVPLLVAIPATGGDEGSTSLADSSSSSYVATVLERKDGLLKLQRDGGEIVILSLDDPGLSLRIDRDVVKGSRVTVSEEKTSSSSRTLTVHRAPSN